VGLTGKVVWCGCAVNAVAGPAPSGPLALVSRGVDAIVAAVLAVLNFIVYLCVRTSPALWHTHALTHARVAGVVWRRSCSRGST
jgi:hypothetical protein